MPENHRNAPKITQIVILQKDVLLNAAMKKNVPTTKHKMGMGSHMLLLFAHQPVR